MIFGLFLIDRTREYVTFLDPSTIIILIHFFPVKKGDDDIRFVFNGSSYDLNEVLRASSFWLPSSSIIW